MNWTPLTRREFIERSVAWVGAAAAFPAAAQTGTSSPTAVDRVVLGRTGLRPSRLGMGTGSNNGAEQTALGKPGFTRLVHDAYDRGIRYFDCAQQYHTFPWMADALEGLPRDDLFLLSKIWAVPPNPAQVIDDHLRNFRTDHLDCLLLHCATRADWVDERQTVVEALVRAKAQGKIRAIGVSCHTLPALRAASRADFIDVNLVRVNPQCAHTDREPNSHSPPEIAPVLAEVRRMKERGNGVIGMKMVGNGDFRDPADRERAIQFAMTQSGVDAVTIGFTSVAQIDEAIHRINRALAPA